MTAEFWTAIAEAGGTLVAAAIAAAAFVSTQRDSRARTRPVISVYPRLTEGPQDDIEVVFVNVGRSVASDISVTLETQWHQTERVDEILCLWHFRQANGKISLPLLGPGQEIAEFVCPHHMFNPPCFDLLTSYRDDGGRQFNQRTSIDTKYFAEIPSVTYSTDAAMLEIRRVVAIERIANKLSPETIPDSVLHPNMPKQQ